MATTTKQNDLAKLQTDIALLKQFNADVVRPSLEDLKDTQRQIQEALEKLDYISRSEFHEHKVEIDRRFKEARKRTWLQNTLSAIAGAVLTLLATYFIKDLLNK